MLTKVITAPTSEPVTLSEMKDHLRVEHREHNTMLEGLIKASRQWVESTTGRALMSQTRSVLYKDWPDDDVFALPYPPIQSVTSVVYTSASGTEATFSSNSYTVITAREPGLLVLGYQKVWPTTTLHNDEWPIEIQYECGYESSSAIPQSILDAIKLDVERRYDRPPEGYAKRLDDVIDMLLSPYKVWGGRL